MTQVPDVGILSGRLLFAFQAEMFRRLAERGHADIRPRHGAVLAYLEPDGTRATDLALRSGQHKQVVGRLIDELEELGYVGRAADPSDRRAKLIVPTARGLDQMAQARTVRDELEAEYRAAFGAQEWDAFVVAFDRLVRVVTRLPEEG